MACCCVEATPETEDIPQVEQQPAEEASGAEEEPRKEEPKQAEEEAPPAAPAGTPTKEFEVTLIRDETGKAKIGLDIHHHKDGTTLKVKTVKPEGLVDLWNKDNPDVEVLKADSIISVNNTTGSAEEMLALIGKEQRLVLKIRRSVQES